jgi:outer membrane receptor for ferrienterochelin and colicin
MTTKPCRIRKRRTLSASLCVPLLHYSTCLAQDLSLQELMKVNVVTTTTLNPVSLSSAPATVYLLQKSQIRHRGYQSLEDLLSDIPAIEIQRHSGQGLGNAYSVRGIQGN